MDFAAYSGLFLISLGAATVLPLNSEVAIVGLLLSGNYPWEFLVFFASLGNILGSSVNWFLGRSVARFQDRRWFPASQETMQRTLGWYRRYGRYSLLLSWVPIIGDPLTLAAGVLREPPLSFLVLVGIAKVGRYLALTAITLN